MRKREVLAWVFDKLQDFVVDLLRGDTTKALIVSAIMAAGLIWVFLRWKWFPWRELQPEIEWKPPTVEEVDRVLNRGLGAGSSVNCAEPRDVAPEAETGVGEDTKDIASKTSGRNQAKQRGEAEAPTH